MWQALLRPDRGLKMDRSLLLSVTMMSAGMLLIPLGDTAGKIMTSAGVAPVFVGWTRYLIGGLILLPFAGHIDAFRLLTDWRIWLRAVLQTLTIVCILTALKTEAIANVFGAFFVGPIISYALSVWLLREQGSALRIVLLCLGLLGVLLVVKPGFGMTAGLGWAVLSGTFYGCFLTASRWLAPLGRPTHILLTQLLIGAALLTPFGLLNMPQVTGAIAGLIGWSALASMLGNLFLVFAYQRATASVLAPFVYVQLIGAAAYGVVFFGDVPDGLAAIGLLIIFISGFATLFLPRN
jgi:drug/metabolite transporter (DMT)-like permease